VAAGFDVHLTKPIDFNVLHQILSDVGRPASQAAGQSSAR